MQDPLGGRNSAHSSELRRTEQEVSDCEECEGTGRKRRSKNDMLAILSDPTKRDKLEAKQLKEFKESSLEHSRKIKENINNSSFRLCRCRVRTDLKRQIIVANLPPSVLDIRYKDIIERDVSVHGKRVAAKAFTKHYPNKFPQARRDAIGCNFFGGYGRGKTYIAQAIAYYIAKKRYTVHYIPFYELVDLATAGLIASQLYREVMAVDLLIIDDIGNEQKHRRRACGELAYLLDKRRERKKPTIFIFNELLKRSDILEAYDSAFFQVCARVNMDVVFKTSVADEKTNKARIIKLNRTLG